VPRVKWQLDNRKGFFALALPKSGRDTRLSCYAKKEIAMPFAIRIHRPGGPEVMCWEEVEVADPAPGEARVRHQAVGLNYIDIYHRSGLYPLQLPNGLGLEAAGVVEAVGAGVT
jgi:hypothetical protein